MEIFRYVAHLAIIDHDRATLNRRFKRLKIIATNKYIRLLMLFVAANKDLKTVQRLSQVGREAAVGIHVHCKNLSVTLEETHHSLLNPWYFEMTQGHMKI